MLFLACRAMKAEGVVGIAPSTMMRLPTYIGRCLVARGVTVHGKGTRQHRGYTTSDSSCLQDKTAGQEYATTRMTVSCPMRDSIAL